MGLALLELHKTSVDLMVSLRLLVALLAGIIVVAVSAIALIDLTGGSTGNATAVGQLIAVITPAVTVLIALIYIEANAIRGRAEQNDMLVRINAVGERTHALVNSQRTIQLRLIARLTRRVADDNPHDQDAQVAAETAQTELDKQVLADATDAAQLSADLRDAAVTRQKRNGGSK